MANGDDVTPPEWTPSPYALQVARWDHPNDENPTTIALWHPTAPFLRHLDAQNENAIRASTLEYLKAADERAKLGLPELWLEDLALNEPSARFGWVPLENEDRTSGFSSVRFERHYEGRVLDRTLVLMTSQKIGDVFLGSEFGIRVVAHVRELGEARHELRITGMSAVLPFGPYHSNLSADGRIDAFDYQPFLTRLAPRVAVALDLHGGLIFFRGFRVARRDQGHLVQCRGQGLAKPAQGAGAAATPYEFVTLAIDPGDGTDPVVISLGKVPLVADAGPGRAFVFENDPASQADLARLRSRRPTREQDDLDRYRVEKQIGTGPDVPLEERELRVLQSLFVIGEHPSKGVKRVHLPDTGSEVVPPLRSNTFAAISAFYNFRELFKRLSKYKIDSFSYFRFAQLPLQVAYRSAVRPGPGKDGLTVNARVLPEGWTVDDVGPNPGKPRLGVHLALADLSRRQRLPWNRRDRSQVEYLGIAADPRWMWHEAGHILLMAATGELELRFAHSPGDALAAIVTDPDSELARDDLTARGATFPWVFLPRRHDRCVRKGWSWSGSQHRALRRLPDAKRLRHKGYWSEQILSSSLFRLYRCLGGDSRDREARRFAADYALYLIMRGTRLLGSSLLVPAIHPEQLVAALIDADIGTARFPGDLLPDGSYPPGTRIGGAAHKVVRWAFEAQGLYPAEPDKNTNAPGLPEEIDIYIQDGRPREEVLHACTVEHGSGGYVPVPLHWPAADDGPDAPAWLAEEEGIRFADDEIRVWVNNRGRAVAQAVSVRVWQREYGDGARPNWNDGGWTEITPAPPAQDVPPGSRIEFGPFGFAPAAGTAHLVFAQATCEADRANSDPLSGLPCSEMEAPLVDLVSGDNNLGLTVVRR